MSRAAMSIILIGLLAISFKTGAYSQPQAANGASPDAQQASPGNAGSAAVNAERDKIWNSPTMLHARAWVQEYCAASAKITPAEAKQYMAELEKLTPVQMKLWLLKYDHEHEQIVQRQADFNRVRSAAVQGAMAVQKQTATDYAAINQDSTEAAETEEGKLAAQQQFSDQMVKQKTAASDAASSALLTNPLGGFGYGGYGGYGLPGGASYHVHVHTHR